MKKEIVICDRKLLARNERIQNLEVLLGNSDNRLQQRDQRYEAQIQVLKQRLAESESFLILVEFV
jgi:kinesin family protein 5